VKQKAKINKSSAATRLYTVQLLRI